MTESRSVSIDEVRALVTERQRYDDWLSALEERRAETPTRVFDRVHGDYSGRRREVLGKLREHVSGLASMAHDLDTSLASLDARLGALEDERAEAMLRTAVGEFDDDRWEQVRQDVESQIADLGEQRTTLLAEVDEVRTLLSNAQSEPEVDETASPEAEENVSHVVAEGQADVSSDADAMSSDEGAAAASTEAEGAPVANAESSDLATLDEGQDGRDLHDHGVEPIDEPLVDVMGMSEAAPVLEMPRSSTEVTEEIGDSLAMFSHDASVPPTADQSSATRNATSLDGLDVFDDAELGDLRMSPPVRSTATATPPGSPTASRGSDVREQNTAHGTAAQSAARDGFDDLAFLRSVVDPSAANGAARASSPDQQKTLRCTECGTMNLPTEWYCERCGGELAAF